jgi:hypothetical protein
MRIIERIRVPALVITAADDPFVPSNPFRDPRITGNPCLSVAICEHGGHCGFVGPATGEDDGYWAENRIVEFVATSRASQASRRLPAGTYTTDYTSCISIG